jgi:lipoprotein signal peptidase
VVDFIDLNFWPMREWPVFNLADTSIVTGVTVLALLMVREEWLARKRKQAAQDDG